MIPFYPLVSFRRQSLIFSFDPIEELPAREDVVLERRVFACFQRRVINDRPPKKKINLVAPDGGKGNGTRSNPKPSLSIDTTFR